MCRESTSDIPNPWLVRLLTPWYLKQQREGVVSWTWVGGGGANITWQGLPDRSYDFEVRETASQPTETSQGKNHRNKYPNFILCHPCNFLPVLLIGQTQLEEVEFTDVCIYRSVQSRVERGSRGANQWPHYAALVPIMLFSPQPRSWTVGLNLAYILFSDLTIL